MSSPTPSRSLAPRVRWSVLMVVVGALVASLFNVFYTNHVQHQTEQRFAQGQRRSDMRWCALLTSLDQSAVPRTTPAGRYQQALIHSLVISFGCGGTP